MSLSPASEASADNDRYDNGSEALNLKVLQMWSGQKELCSAYFQPSTAEEIAEIERLVGTNIPDDYRGFLLEYSTVIGADSIGLMSVARIGGKKIARMGAACDHGGRLVQGEPWLTFE
ncbi:hypothetical protein [Mesorhizobium sp. CAU 1732]|uniref:hypothetical protein n=1 Tax=Mesorhizobium sp. CAU 1732 TaxID=3140358 RepID=UPI0032609847